MIKIENGEMSDEEAYANAYAHFLPVLKLLAEDAETQCKTMGYFNVAWELKDDASRDALAVLNLSGENLSQEQRDGLTKLLEELNAIPDAVINVANVKEEHIRTMSHPCWIPLRTHAVELIHLLDSETQRTNAFFNRP